MLASYLTSHERKKSPLRDAAIVLLLCPVERKKNLTRYCTKPNMLGYVVADKHVNPVKSQSKIQKITFSE